MATASVVSMGDAAVQKTEPFGPGESMQISRDLSVHAGFHPDRDRAMTTTAASQEGFAARLTYLLFPMGRDPL